MDAPALPRHQIFSWRALLLALGVLLVLGAVSFGGGTAVWLRSYAPLEQGSTWGALWARGHSEGVVVDPLAASGGVPVVFPRYRPGRTFHVTVTLANRGRLAVTVLGLPKAWRTRPGVFVPTGMEIAPPRDYGFHWKPLDPAHPVRINPGEERAARITYRFGSHCVGGQPKHYWNEHGVAAASDNHVGVRIRYAHIYDHTQTFEMPFVLELVCSKGMLSPS